MKFLNSKKKVLLCGGTNFLGPHLVDRLVAMGYDITICTRGIHKIPHEDLVKKIVCDCNNDDEGAKRVLGGMEYDVVIDCISYCPKEVFNVLSNVKTSRYIQVSSIGVYWDSVTDEDRELNLPIFERRFNPQTYKDWKMEVDNTVGYGNRKKYAECAAYQLFPQCNPVSIRPAYVADPSNLQHMQNVRLPELVNWIKKGKKINPINKNYAVCFTRADEEADLIIKLMSNSYQKPTNISSNGFIKISDIAAHIAERLGADIIYNANGKYPNFPSGINLNVDRLSEIGFESSGLFDWFWEYLDYYIDHPIESYQSWETVRSAIDTFRGI